MAQKNDTPLLLLALILSLGMVGAGVWWFLYPRGGSIPQTSPTSEVLPVVNSVEQRLSQGERLLIQQGVNPDKQRGIEAIAAGDFPRAIAALESSLVINGNDPEALIYLHNARIGNQKSYTLAIVVPIETQVNTAQELLRGAAQAQQEINQQGGIGGIPVKILIGDDGNSPEVGVEIAQKLVRNQEVLAVIGHFSSQVTLETAPIYEDGRLVMISPTATSVDLSNAGDYIFRTVPSDRFTGSTLSRYLIQQLPNPRVAVFYHSQSNYSRSLKNEFTTALFADGGEVVAEFDLASAMFSPSNSVKQSMDQGAKALVLVSDTTVFPAALQVVASNNRRLPIVAGDSLYKPEILQIGGEKAVGMVVAIPWHILADSDSAFPQSSLQLWRAEVNWRTALAYDAAQALFQAIASQPTRLGIQAALSTPGFRVEGASGEIRFLPSGDRHRALQLVAVQPGQHTGFGYDFIPIN